MKGGEDQQETKYPGRKQALVKEAVQWATLTSLTAASAAMGPPGPSAQQPRQQDTQSYGPAAASISTLIP